jgi:phosphatidylglycerol:prolipoprotein diacylglycerol transferase
VQHWFVYPNWNPVAFRAGPLAVHWYGLSYLFGFVCVYLWMNRPEGRRRLGLTSEEIQDFLVYALAGVLIGGRTMFVVADSLSPHGRPFLDYLLHPLNLIAVWNGGMGFFGGMVGVIVAAVLFLRKHPRMRLSALLDEVAMMLPLPLATTRIVNFINDELPGRLCVPDRPFCIAFPNYDGYRYPSQLFEAALDLAVLPLLLLLYRRRPPAGVVAWTWFTLYGVCRSVAEIWRQTDIAVGPLTGGQLLALPMIAIGAFLVYRSIQASGPLKEMRPSV